jgi:hypothetical protein
MLHPGSLHQSSASASRQPGFSGSRFMNSPPSGLNGHPGLPVFDSPNLPLAGHIRQCGQATLGQPQFLPPSADAPTELLAQTAVKCSSFHLAA